VERTCREFNANTSTVNVLCQRSVNVQVNVQWNCPQANTSTPDHADRLSARHDHGHFITPGCDFKEAFGANFGDDYFLASYHRIGIIGAWRPRSTVAPSKL